MRTRWFGCAKGRPRRKKLSMRVKIALFAPIPSARVKTAMKVKAGALSSWRRAKRRSFIAQGNNRIDPGGAAGGKPAGEEGNSRERDDGGEERAGIEAADI